MINRHMVISKFAISGDIIGAMKLINDLNSDLLDENAEINFQLKVSCLISF